MQYPRSHSFSSGSDFDRRGGGGEVTGRSRAKRLVTTFSINFQLDLNECLTHTPLSKLMPGRPYHVLVVSVTMSHMLRAANLTCLWLQTCLQIYPKINLQRYLQMHMSDVVNL